LGFDRNTKPRAVVGAVGKNITRILVYQGKVKPFHLLIRENRLRDGVRLLALLDNKLKPVPVFQNLP
tara:strand:- start:85 stop:285 length:201 start_codon:yes stop_codon:yes gene_type:complete